jgi:hypothetical protein
MAQTAFVRPGSSAALIWRVLLLCAAAILTLAGILHPQFRDGEGAFAASVCIPLSLAAAMFLMGITVHTAWRQSGFWLAVLMASQASSLQLIDAGRRLHYQHFYPLRDAAAAHPFLVTLLALQAIAVCFGMRRHFRTVAGWLTRNLGIAGSLCAFVFLFLASAALSANPKHYVAEVVFAGALQTLQAATLMLAAISVPQSSFPAFRNFLDRILGAEKTPVPARLRKERLLWGCVIWTTAVAALLNVLAYQRQPHITDEIAYVYHARYLAEGKLALSPPPVASAFETYLVTGDRGKWFAVAPPGWPAALAVATYFGVPWLANPLLAGLNTLLAFLIMREVLGQRMARLGLLLLCVSPWWIFMAMSYMTHTWTTTCALGGAWAMMRCRQSGRAAWCLLAGASIGMATLIRPLDGLLVAAILGLNALGLGARRLSLPALTLFGLGTALTGSLVLPYNQYLSGNPLQFPVNAYVDRLFGPGSNSLGFGPNRGMPFGGLEGLPGHGLADAAINAALNTFSVNIEMFGWATGSLIFAVLMIFSRRMKKADWLALTAIALVVGTFSLYWYSGGPDFGARYWYLVLIPVLILTLRGIAHLAEASDTSSGGVRVHFAVAALCLSGLVNYFPWRAIDKYYHFWGVRPDVRQLAQQHKFGRSLVFVRGDAFPDYVSAWMENPLDFSSDAPIFAPMRSSEEQAELRKAYAGRPVWVLDGPSITHAGFRVASKPEGGRVP